NPATAWLSRAFLKGKHARADKGMRTETSTECPGDAIGEVGQIALVVHVQQQVLATLLLQGAYPTSCGQRVGVEGCGGIGEVQEVLELPGCYKDLFGTEHLGQQGNLIHGDS